MATENCILFINSKIYHIKKHSIIAVFFFIVLLSYFLMTVENIPCTIGNIKPIRKRKKNPRIHIPQRL